MISNQCLEILLAVIQAAEEVRKLSMVYAIATFFLTEVTKLCFSLSIKKNSRNFKTKGNYSGPTDVYTSFLIFSVQSMES